MVKLNMKDVKDFEKLPKGKFNVEIVDVEIKSDSDDKELLTVKHKVIDDEKFNGTILYKNFSPESEKALQVLRGYLKTCGLSDADINGITDTKQIVKLISGCKLTITNKPSKDFNWGNITNWDTYEG